MRIRAAENEDLDRIRNLLQACELPTEDIDSSLLPGFIVAIADDGALAGCICLQPLGDKALLRSLAVVSSRRKAGLGESLLLAIESEAKARADASVWLLTTTARDFFESHGYQVIERSDVPDEVRETAQFARLCPSTAACMGKHIF